MRIVEAWHDEETNVVYFNHDDVKTRVMDIYAVVDENMYLQSTHKDYFEAELEICEVQGGVAIGPDFLAIYDEAGEIVRWVEDEWLEDPALALNLANAVRLYYTKGPAFIRQALGK